MRRRFRGFLPVVIDVETAGVDPLNDALLEVCAVTLTMTPEGLVRPKLCLHEHIEPFPGANLDADSLAFNKIDPTHPFRFALNENIALQNLITPIKEEVKAHGCSRAILVGHNAWFDLLFLNQAMKRTALKSPFHQFSSIDTASLSALLFGQTVLAKAMNAAKIEFNSEYAHSAIYDAEKTAELFCKMVNDHPLAVG
jgi:ribonuclease T